MTSIFSSERSSEISQVYSYVCRRCISFGLPWRRDVLCFLVKAVRWTFVTARKAFSFPTRTRIFISFYQCKKDFCQSFSCCAGHDHEMNVNKERFGWIIKSTRESWTHSTCEWKFNGLDKDLQFRRGASMNALNKAKAIKIPVVIDTEKPGN